MNPSWAAAAGFWRSWATMVRALLPLPGHRVGAGAKMLSLAESENVDELDFYKRMTGFWSPDDIVARAGGEAALRTARRGKTQGEGVRWL